MSSWPEAAPSSVRVWSGHDEGRASAALPATTLLRLRHDPDIGLRRFPALRIDRLGLVVADRAGNDDVLALLPVGRRCDAMVRRHLQRIDYAQGFLEIAPCRHRIDQHQLDLLVRSDDENV